MSHSDPTYVIFDGDNDVWAYAYMKGWCANERVPFDFRDAHDLTPMTSRAQDEQYVKSQLRQRLQKSAAAIVLVGQHAQALPLCAVGNRSSAGTGLAHHRDGVVMNLTDEQVLAIQEWARLTPQVEEVRLFGSRAKGCARPDSDVDLAVTVGGSKGATVPGNYVALANVWEDHLRQATGLDVRIKQYNSTDSFRVRRWCDEFCVILFAEEDGLRPK